MEDILSLSEHAEDAGIPLTSEHELWAEVIRRAVLDCDPKHSGTHNHSEAAWFVFADPEATGSLDILEHFGNGEMLLEKMRRIVANGRVYQRGKHYRRRADYKRSLKAA